MSKARSLADLISGGAVIEASEIADSTITGSKLASDIAITTTGTISTPSIIGLSSLTIENVNIDNNSITSIASNIEQVSYTSVTTNILLYSQTYSNSYWNKANSSITENATTAPDGTTTASKFNENTVNTQHRVIRSSLVTGVAASKTFTFSSHFKAAERSAVKMEIYADGQAVTSYALFGLSGDGTVGDTFAVDSTAITSVGNGWYRCSITRTVNSSASGLRVYHITATGTSNGDDSYAGSTSNGIYFWGSQLEEGLITSYLPTTSASLSGITGVTRGVSGTTAATASSGTTITLGSISTTISANIDATQIGIPLASLTGVAASGSAVIGNSNIDLNLSASGTGNVKLGNDEKLVFGDAGENISGDGTSLTITSSHNTVIDSANQIILDARNGANIYFRDDGILIGQVLKSGNNDFKLKALQSGKDLVLEGLDSGGSLVQALTLDMSAAGAATFSDKIILGANKSIELGDPGDRIYGDGTNLQIVSSNALGFDVANGIILDSGSGGTILRAGGSTTYGTLTSNSGDFSINQTTSDKDIIFTGNDGGSAITALTLDMSEAGNATFNADVTVAGNLTVNGTTTTLNTATLDIEDKTLCIAKGAANAAAADGAGIIVDGASACLTFTNSTNSWDFNENVIIQRPSNEPTNLIVGNSINNHEIAVCRSGSNPSFVKMQAHTNEPKIMFCTLNSNGGLRFSDSSDNVLMKLTTAGRLGIGTTNPGTVLHIVGSDNPTLRIGSSTSTSGNAQIELIGKNSGVDASTATIWADYNGQLNLNSANNVEIRNGNTTSLRVVSNGNIGIGTSSPTNLLEVYGTQDNSTSNGSGYVSSIADDTTGAAAGVGGGIVFKGIDGTSTLRALSSIRGYKTFSGNNFDGSLMFATRTNGVATLTDRMVITNIGNVGIGTSSPSTLLHLSSSDPQITITDTDGTGSQVIKAVTNDLTLDAVSSINLDADSGVITFKDGGTQFGSITKSGNDLRLVSSLSDGDLVFRGNDGGVGITALTLDMSEAGNATFNGDVTVENYLRIDNSGSEVLNIRGEPNYGTLSVGNRTLNLLANATIFLDDEFNELMRMHTNGNIGIGTSSPTSTVDIRGANGAVQSRGLLYLSNNDTYGINKGSQISFGGTYDSTNDTFFAAVAGRKENGTSGNYEGYLQFSTRQTSGNNERMRITSGGCVGIGHTNPVRNLSVFKSDYPTIQLVNSTSSTGSTDGAIIQLHNTDMDLVIRNQENADIRFDTNGANERMRIMADGKVGIGVGNAQRTLHVKSSAEIVSGLFESAASTNLIRIVDSNTTSESQAAAIGSAGDNMTLTTNGSERMRIDSSGNVGIGTSSPISDARLTVSSDNSESFIFFERSGSTRFDSAIGMSSSSIVFKGGVNSSTVSGLNEFMRIDGSGDVLIATTSFSSGSRGKQFEINTNAVSLRSGSATTSLTFHNEFHNPNGAVGSIRTSGTSTSYVTSSDYRLKENVSYDFDATTRLKQLKPARFNFIADADTTVDGFLAHEVSSVVPEAISGEKDAVDDDGNPKYQGIDQSKLVPLLVKTIQELEARITQLENA